MELAEKSMPGKGMDELNNACENVASHYRLGTDTREVLEASLENEDVGDCNSFATEPLHKGVETSKSLVCDVVSKSPNDILPLPKAPEKRQRRKRKKDK